ncbi:hypothetical protein DBR46_29540 [Pseudomonas sp. KBW05]|nr:hypothetical protein DBR46_29540 [Pseudomonas sp. KBW05]
MGVGLCGSGLARECGVSVNASVADPPHSRASPLPHLDTHLSQDQRYAVAIPCLSSRHSGAPISNSRQINGRRS